MAKALMKWELELTDGFIAAVSFETTGATKRFDLEELFIHANLEDWDEAEINTVFNGVKQKLADSVAPKEIDTDEARIAKMEELWKRLTEDRKWNLERKGGVGGGISKAKYGEVLYFAVKGMLLGGMDEVAISVALKEKLEAIKEIVEGIKKEEESEEE